MTCLDIQAPIGALAVTGTPQASAPSASVSLAVRMFRLDHVLHLRLVLGYLEAMYRPNIQTK